MYVSIRVCETSHCVWMYLWSRSNPPNSCLNVSLAARPDVLQGGLGSWQKNAWEWASKIKATLSQAPGSTLGFSFHGFPPLNQSGPLPAVATLF